MKTAELNLTWSYSIVETLVKSDITNFYVSPGLRNTPIIKAIINNPKAKHFTGIDERAQSYRAIGSIKAENNPAVLVCTSGTALANYYPAVIEAFQDNLPLIILSADRPIELVWSQANQAIDQKNIFQNFVSKNINLETPSINQNIQSIINHIFYSVEKTKNLQLPLHINIPFKEPLTITDFKFDFDKVTPTLSQFSTKHMIELDQNIINLIKKSSKYIISIGQLSNKDYLNISKLLELTCFKYLDITSNLKFKKNCNDYIIPSFDHIEINDYFNENIPTLIIHFGGNITSKKFNQFVKNNDIPVININSKHTSNNLASSQSYFLDIPSRQWEEHFIPILPNTNYYKNFQEDMFAKINIINDSPLSIPWISKHLVENLETSSILYIGNSTAIRSFDLYSSIQENKNHQIYFNRGVSGIEGFIASAVGVSESNPDKEVYLILGDISFLHDLNSLSLLRELKQNSCVKIIILNNYSGGIFSLLPINQDKDVLDIISTKHKFNFKGTASDFNIKYTLVDSLSTFNEIFNKQGDFENTIYEVIIDENTNQEVYSKLRSIK